MRFRLCRSRARIAGQAAVLLTVAHLCACSGGSPAPAAPSPTPSPSPAPGAPTVTSVRLTGSLQLLLGQSTQLTATATMSDATTKDVTADAAWQSSDSGVAAVSNAGRVTTSGGGASTITASYQGQSGTAQVTVAGVASLRVTGSAFTLVGQTTHLAAVATFSNGATQVVTEVATWQSSDSRVAAISGTGAITAAALGRSTISASYHGRSATLDLTVSTPGTGSAMVRLVYAVPQDRPARPQYASAIANAFRDLQVWFLQQLSGRTFALHSPQPELCMLPRPASHYPNGAYSKLLADLQGCGPIRPGGATAWVVYADLEDGCNDPGRLGVGAVGYAVMGSGDLKGLLGERVIDSCGVEHVQPVGRYIGGAGHELGHAFGLQHPADCDAGLPTCDWSALMFTGYVTYPNTYLRDDEKQLLLNSPYFR